MLLSYYQQSYLHADDQCLWMCRVGERMLSIEEGIMLDRSHDEAMVEQLRADPSYALALLTDVLLAGSPEEQAIVLRQIVAAFGPD